jgi:hypothetical protein
MGQTIRQEKVWKDCERVGEQQVMFNLASGGICEWHQHAKNWLALGAELETHQSDRSCR